MFVTHDVDEAMLLGDRIAVLQRGRPHRAVRRRRPSCWPGRRTTFVADFLGHDRGLKLLSLRSAAEVPVTDVGDAASTAGC